MATFVKPENALKRAEELIAVGKKEDALETLHAALLHRRFKNQWTITLESIVERHLGLCVELKKIRTAREGLHQYRATCQAANISSLEKVVRVFRQAAEDKVHEAKKEQDIKASHMADLDELEAPETILLQAIQAGDTRQQSQDKDVHTHFRFLWDSYKVILDVLKSNNRLEDVYHETSRHAFEFCKANSRPQEFKRLCDILRKNYQDLFKRTGAPQNAVQPGNADTATKTLETRCRQMQVATELDLWREAYFTAAEVCELMVKTRPKPHLRSMYYEYLGQIFWKSENYLFHAFASLKNVLFVKAAKQTVAKNELELLASRAVLATLCVPFQKSSEMQASLEMSTESASQSYEKAKKYASLFSAQSVPNRDSISSQIIEKSLLPLASEPCKRLFALIESDFTPLSLCQDAKPFLDQINQDDVCEGKLKNYVTPLKQIIFFRLMKQLSEVYVSMTIEDFERAASIVPFNIAEKWMANASRQQGINIQINYMQQAIVFGAATKVDMKSMRQPLIEIGYKLQQAMQRVAQEELHKKDKLDKVTLLTNIRERMEKETKMIRLRKDEIERRKEESEKKKQIREREAMKKLREQEEAEAAAERKRQDEERRRREADREEQRRKEAEIAKNKEMLEQMKKQAEQKAANLKVGGKKITEIEEEDLEKISFDQIEKAREAQLLRDRQDKIRNRKMENKRIDHLARALREEQLPLLEDWAIDIEDTDQKQLDEAEKRNEGEQRKKHEELLAEKRQLSAFVHAKEGWMEPLLDDRRDDYEEQLMAQRRRLLQKVAENKVERARKRKDAYEAEQRAREESERRKVAEEKRRKDDERRRREEEEREVQREEDRRVAEEKRREDDERRARAEARQRERQRELEEREREEKAQREAARDAPRRAAGTAEPPGPWRREGAAAPKDEGDSWRRREEPPKAADEKRAPESQTSRADWRKRGEEAEDMAPRRPAAGTRPAPKEEDSWRRGDDARGARGDDAPAPGPWRRPGGRQQEEEERPPAKSSGRGDDDSAWGRGGARGAGGGGTSAPKRDEDAGPWRKGAGRDAPAREPAREPAEEAPRRAAPAAAAPAAPAAKAEAEDDEGWGTVASKKKGKKTGGDADEGEWRTAAPAKKPVAGDAGDRRPTPPWKRPAKK